MSACDSPPPEKGGGGASRLCLGDLRAISERSPNDLRTISERSPNDLSADSRLTLGSLSAPENVGVAAATFRSETSGARARDLVCTRSVLSRPAYHTSRVSNPVWDQSRGWCGSRALSRPACLSARSPVRCHTLGVASALLDPRLDAASRLCTGRISAMSRLCPRLVWQLDAHEAVEAARPGEGGVEDVVPVRCEQRLFTPTAVNRRGRGCRTCDAARHSSSSSAEPHSGPSSTHQSTHSTSGISAAPRVSEAGSAPPGAADAWKCDDVPPAL